MKNNKNKIYLLNMICKIDDLARCNIKNLIKIKLKII